MVWFAEPLKMHDLPLSQELDWISDIGIIGKAKDIIICRAGFLLCCHVKIATYCSFVGSEAPEYLKSKAS